jgi:hypothetical protein
MQKYHLTPTGNSRCPQCDKYVALLATDGNDPAFYICFSCKFVRQVGVGPKTSVTSNNESQVTSGDELPHVTLSNEKGMPRVLSFYAWLKKDQDITEEFEETSKTCPKCDGSGEVECPTCGHDKECEACGGSGEIEVDACESDKARNIYYDRLNRDLEDWKAYQDLMAVAYLGTL